jgi:glucose-1-phosphate adenylyltransferase
MSQEIIGVINLIHEPDELDILTTGRCLASVPFGARFRLIDFTLSSMVNSGMNKVAVFAHTKYRSLMDHLGSGRHWDLDNRQSGLFLLPPIAEDMSDLKKGDLYHFFMHRDFFLRSQGEYVMITRSHMVCNIDFTKALKQHIVSQADITMVYKQQANIRGKARKIALDESGRVTAIQDHYGRLQSDMVSMEMYLMRKDALLDLVETSLAQGRDHLVRQTIMSQIDKLKIYGYRYEGFLGVINTIDSYYDNSMKLLQPEVWRNLFFNPGPVFTKVKDEPPARYLEGSDTSHSIIANGCVIEGTVQNSILFRGVKIGKGAQVKNSIVMQNGLIQEGSQLNYVILDKEVCIEREQDIRGVINAPYLAMKRKII